ncbi:MAG: tetratricopeptide repeat protein [Thermodesulfovibrionales bacterium]
MDKASKKKSKGAESGPRCSGPSQSVDVGRFLQKPLIHILLIAVLGLLAYSNTFHSPFMWDEKREIIENPVIKDLGNFLSNTKGYDYNPRRFIGYLTFALNYHFGRLNVTGYHAVNLVIHITNALLVYFLVVLTFRTPSMRQSTDPSPPAPVLLALVTALLFVAHPLQTQAVTYVVQRFASLATLCYLLSLVMYIKGRLGLEHPEVSVRKGGFSAPFSAFTFFFLSLAFAVCAMKTKEIAFTLPLVIVLYEVTFFKSSLKKKLLFLLPVLLTLIIVPISILHSDKPLGEILSDVSEKTKVQTDLSRWEYLMTEMRVIVTYLRLIFVPARQNLDYDYPTYHTLFTPPVCLSFVFLLAVFCTALYLLYQTRQKATGKRQWAEGKSEESVFDESPADSAPCPFPVASLYRLIAFGILWFFITLSVESSVIPIVDVIFEHRVYLPSVGLFLAMTAGAFVLANRPGMEKVVIPSLVLVTLVLSGITYARNTVWKDEISLWRDVVLKSSDKARPHNNLGYAYYMKGHLHEAVAEYQIALRLDPDFADAHNNLGSAYYRQGRFNESTVEFEAAVKLNPGDVRAHSNLAAAYGTTGRMDEALREFQAALTLNPDYADAYNNLGSVYFRQGLIDKALKEYQTALKLNPDYADAHSNLGGVYFRQGRLDDALREFQAALTLNADLADAHNNLGSVYFRQGLIDKALGEYQAALALNPDYAEAHNNLGSVYSRQGHPDEALREYQTALALKPDYIEAENNIRRLSQAAQKHSADDADAHNDRGSVYYGQGLIDEALREYQAALKLRPDYVEAHNNLGSVYSKLGQPQLAIKEYQAALKLNPDFADAHNNLGRVYGKGGRLDPALREYQAALRLKPDLADAHDGLGNVYSLKGRLDEAIKEYQTALRLKPDDADAHNNLGTVYYRQGRMDDALREFQTALRLKPNDPGARGNLELLYKNRGKQH